MIKLFKPFIANPKCLEEVLSSGILTQGSKVDEFENKLNNHFSTKYSVTLNSCTSAIDLSFKLLKTEINPEKTTVLSSPLTCAATNFPIIQNGYTIKWCDIDKDTLNISLEDVRKKLHQFTRILIFVHWGGTPVEYDELDRIRWWYFDKYGCELYIIEDCAHSFGSTFMDKPLQHSEYFSCFSFQAIKALTTGDGGLLIPPTEDVNEEFYKRARLLRWFGLDRDNNIDFRSCQDIVEPGYKYHMNNLSASLGLANFQGALSNVEIHQKNAKFYSENINNKKVKLLPFNKNSSYWLYTILAEDRENFIKYMKNNGIECNTIHIRNDKYTCFNNFQVDLPNLDKIEDHYVCIPVGWWLSFENIKYIVEKINLW